MFVLVKLLTRGPIHRHYYLLLESAHVYAGCIYIIDKATIGDDIIFKKLLY